MFGYVLFLHYHQPGSRVLHQWGSAGAEHVVQHQEHKQVMPFVVNGGTSCLATEASSACAPSWETLLQILVVCRSMLLVPYPTCSCFC